jgi:uncharacterized membrane protein YqjE
MSPEGSFFFLAGENITEYVLWGVLGVSLLAFIAISLSLLYHWYTYERTTPMVQLGALIYILGSIMILMNLWGSFLSIL